MNLLTFLMTDYLEREQNADRSFTDVEWSLHTLDAMLSSLSEIQEVQTSEAQLLGMYLLSTPAELDSIPPQVHEWFLERLCIAPELPTLPELTNRIARIYFLANTGSYQYLTVNALLTLDERFNETRERRSQSHTQVIWSFILNRNNFEGRNKGEMLEQVTDILLDIGQHTNSVYADQALRQLWSDLLDHSELRDIITAQIRKRANETGGTRGKQLILLVRESTEL